MKYADKIFMFNHHSLFGLVDAWYMENEQTKIRIMYVQNIGAFRISFVKDIENNINGES